MSKHVHFLGINGSGASAIAAIAQAQGYKVTGCADKDVRNEFTKPFDPEILSEGHNPAHLKDIDILAITPAVLMHDSNNPELIRAKKEKLEVLTWQQFMGKYLEQDKFIIAVCGTHGKSTTTAMTGKLLEDASLDPTVELGAVVPEWQTNHRVGKSRYFVTEADEYNDNFMPTHPDITIVTSIEMDHPEYFKDFESYQESFYEFLSQTKHTIVANISNPGVAQVLKKLMKETNIQCIDYSKNVINFPLKVIGDFNKQNASAVFQVGLLLNIDPEIIKKSLSSFSGIGRRFELVGECRGAQIYDDFAHHPTEIEVTTKAIREKFPNKKLTVIFQPHMFSRTLSLFDEFVRVFKTLPVEKAVIVDIYHAREKNQGLVSSEKLVQAINNPRITYEKDWDKLERDLEKNLSDQDVVVFMGAGIVNQIGKKLTGY